MTVFRLTALLLAVILVAVPARASSPVVHMVVGDLLGEWAARRVEGAPTVAVALTLGFASHALLDRIDRDYTPDWTRWADARRLSRDAPYLLVQAAGAWALWLDVADEPDPAVRRARIAGMVGSIVPDVIDGVHSLARPDAWLRGDHIMPWHRAGPEPRQDQPWHVTAAFTMAVVSFRLSVSF